MRDRQDVRGTRAGVAILTFVFLLFLSVLSTVTAQQPEWKKSTVQGDTLYTLPDLRDAHRSFDPEYVSIKEAGMFSMVRGQVVPLYFDFESLIVVVGKTEVKAFSPWDLDYREVVNGFIDGQAIAVTWCPFSYTGIVYVAQYDTLRYTFESAGAYWRDALVMRDRETGSLWSQVNGVAIDGERLGDTLELFQSRVMTFGALKKKFPEAKLLKKVTHAPPGSLFSDYITDPVKCGAFGRSFNSDELPCKTLILGIRKGSKAFATIVERLDNPMLFKVRFTESDAIIYVNPNPLTSEAFALEYNEVSLHEDGLTFNSDATVTLKGDRLEVSELSKLPEFSPISVVTAFWFAWKDFYPQAEVVHPYGEE